jgi:hypothetical protein
MRGVLLVVAMPSLRAGSRNSPGALESVISPVMGAQGFRTMVGFFVCTVLELMSSLYVEWP